MSDKTTVIVSILPPNTEPPETSKPGADCVGFEEKAIEWFMSKEIIDSKFSNLIELSSEFGGTKVPPPEIWTGCFAHFDEAAFLQFVRALPWIDPARVQVLIMSETGDNPDKWRVFEVDTKPMAPCTPPAKTMGFPPPFYGMGPQSRGPFENDINELRKTIDEQGDDFKP